MSALLVLTLTAPLFFFALHAGARTIPGLDRLSPQALAALVASLGFLIETAALVLVGGTSSPSLIFAAVCASGAAAAYFHVFNMSETARRVRLVVCRYLGKPPPDETDWASSTERRLRRLESMGEVREIGSRWSGTRGPLTGLARCLVAYERWLFPERKKGLQPRMASRNGRG